MIIAMFLADLLIPRFCFLKYTRNKQPQNILKHFFIKNGFHALTVNIYLLSKSKLKSSISVQSVQ